MREILLTLGACLVFWLIMKVLIFVVRWASAKIPYDTDLWDGGEHGPKSVDTKDDNG